MSQKHIIRVRRGINTVIYRSRHQDSKYLAVVVHRHDHNELDDAPQTGISIEDESCSPWPYSQPHDGHLTVEQATDLAQMLAVASVDARGVTLAEKTINVEDLVVE
ncbi:MAG TPA: hypothetical protein VHT30_01560 [Acidimicrobiales bacterium]|jgi:hypothetical protein|nr:hypothetical protein [Acidimicrobiales bacterium]